MDSDDSFTIQTEAGGFADPSMISLNLDDGNAARSLTQKLSVITDTYSMDSTDYGSPLLSADPESGSPLDFEGAKRHQLNYSNYLSGRAQEVAKRRNLIERLEKARDKGILFCTIPQLSELTITQLSMVLRRVLKSSPGLREFVSDEILQTIFEDANSQTPLTADSDRLPQFMDLPNEPDCVTDRESTDVSDEEDSGEKQDLAISKSCQLDFYNLRRHLISADRYAAAMAWKLIEKRNKLTNSGQYEEFVHQEPPKSGDSEEFETSTCVRCRPLVKRPKRRIFCANTESQMFRSDSPPPIMTVNSQCDTDFDFEHKNMQAINVTNKLNTEQIMTSYLNHLGTLSPHFAAKNHAAFSELGRQKDFGFPSEIQSELHNFPLPLKPVHSNIPAQKRRHDSTRDEENELEADINYPLRIKNEAVKTQFLLKHPPKLLKSRSAFPIIRPEESVEERIAPLKIKRSSIQLSSNVGFNDDLERFINPFYKPKTHASPTVDEQIDSSLPTPSFPVQQQKEPSPEPELLSQKSPQRRSSPRSSSPSSSSSGDSSSSKSDSEDNDETINEVEVEPEGSSAADNPMMPVVLPQVDSGAETDDESSTSTNASDIQLPNEDFQDDENVEIMEH